MKHVRLQNDVLRVQVESLNAKAGPIPSFPKHRYPHPPRSQFQFQFQRSQGKGKGHNHSQSQNRSDNQGRGPHLVPCSKPPILQLSKPTNTIKSFLRYIIDNLPVFLKYIPQIIEILGNLIKSFYPPAFNVAASVLKRGNKARLNV
jgi:hypothetical protein